MKSTLLVAIPVGLAWSLFAKAFVYLKAIFNRKLPGIGLLLAPSAAPESFEHDSENVYEWMWVNVPSVPFALNVSREHGWADIEDEIEFAASPEELEAQVKPGPVYLFGWNRTADQYVDELPDWLPQFVANRLDVDVFVYHGRINERAEGTHVVFVYRPGTTDKSSNHAPLCRPLFKICRDSR